MAACSVLGYDHLNAIRIGRGKHGTVYKMASNASIVFKITRDDPQVQT
jgi:hypothetical protein